MKKLKKFLLFIACCLTACAIAIPFAACAEDPDAGGDGGNDGNEQGSGDNTGEETQSGTNVLQSISINELDAKRQFNIGESFSSEGLTVTALITNLGGTGGSQNPDVTDKAVINSSAFDSSKPGTYPIYISYTFGGITLYASYNVTVVSAIEGTIAGLEVSFSGERQYSVVAANSENVPAIDLSKLTVTQVVGADANNTTETALTRSQYELSYSVDGGEAVAVPESQTTIPVTQKGVYSVYASATYTSGGESFEMNGFVAVYAVDPVVSLVYNNDGTKEFDYDTDETIGSDWTYTVSYNSGATVKVGYSDVTLEGIVNDNEGQNSATVTYVEEQLGYSSENQDAVIASYTESCSVNYTIGENPNAGAEVTDNYYVDFASTENGWGEAKDTVIPGTVYVDSDGVRQTTKTDGVISLISEGQAKFKDKNASTEDGTLSFTKAIQMGTIGSTKAWVIDLSEYDAAAVATIKVYASTSSDNAGRTIILNSSASKDSPIATSVPFNAGSTAYLTEWEVAGGAVYYIGSADSSINYFAFDVSVTYKSAESSTELFTVDFASTENGWGEAKDTVIPGTVYVDSDGVRQTTKTDGVISLISEGQAKFKDKNASTEDGTLSFTKAIQMGTIGSTKAWVIDLSEYDAAAVATIKVYASTSSDNAGRTIILNSSASKDSPIATSVPFNAGSTAYLTEWEVAGGAVYYIGSADSSINYFSIVVEVIS